MSTCSKNFEVKNDLTRAKIAPRPLSLKTAQIVPGINEYDECNQPKNSGHKGLIQTFNDIDAPASRKGAVFITHTTRQLLRQTWELDGPGMVSF